MIELIMRTIDGLNAISIIKLYILLAFFKFVSTIIQFKFAKRSHIFGKEFVSKSPFKKE